MADRALKHVMQDVFVLHLPLKVIPSKVDTSKNIHTTDYRLYVCEL